MMWCVPLMRLAADEASRLRRGGGTIMILMPAFTSFAAAAEINEGLSLMITSERHPVNSKNVNSPQTNAFWPLVVSHAGMSRL